MDNKEKLEEAKRLYETANADQRYVLESLFPELMESEDERMVKFIKNQLFNIKKTITENYELDAKLTNAINWLEKQGEHANFRNKIQICDKVTRNEDGVLVNLSQLNRVAKKQGEQKPVDKVEPKFHEGEWVVTDKNNVVQIKAIKDSKYVLENTMRFSVDYVDKCWRKWDISDANDGDVLCCESGWTCIFKVLNSDISFSSYCFMDHTGWFCGTESESHTLDKAFLKAYMGNIYPATKEQHDTLMKAMADAGYTFDFEKKELKKIEQNP